MRTGGPVSQELLKRKARFTESAVSSRQFGSFWPCLQPYAFATWGGEGGGKDFGSRLPALTLARGYQDLKILDT